MSQRVAVQAGSLGERAALHVTKGRNVLNASHATLIWVESRYGLPGLF